VQGNTAMAIVFFRAKKAMPGTSMHRAFPHCSNSMIISGKKEEGFMPLNPLTGKKYFRQRPS
jgi:hypothetical protein